MLNSGSGRLEDIVKNINDARKALQEWQDKKTEALIQFDSLVYDVRNLESERAKMILATQNHQDEIRDQERIYQTHIDMLTDQSQELKLENEQLKLQLQAAHEGLAQSQDELNRVQNQASYESDFLKMKIATLQGEFEAQQAQSVARAKADLEIKISDLQYQYKNQLNVMTEQLQSIHVQKSEMESKAAKLEQDLKEIRAQMMNALRVNDAVASEKMTVTSAPSTNPGNGMSAAQAGTSNATRGNGAASPTASDISANEGRLRAIEFENPGFVQDYLKRLGY